MIISDLIVKLTEIQMIEGNIDVEVYHIAGYCDFAEHLSVFEYKSGGGNTRKVVKILTEVTP